MSDEGDYRSFYIKVKADKEHLEEIVAQKRKEISELQEWLKRVEKRLDAITKGWLRAVDEELVNTHLGVANASDSYEEAKKKLNALICWHTAVATDPAVNGGYRLVPLAATWEMLDAAPSPKPNPATPPTTTPAPYTGSKTDRSAQDAE